MNDKTDTIDNPHKVSIRLTDGNYYGINPEIAAYIQVAQNSLNRITFLWILTLIVWWFK